MKHSRPHSNGCRCTTFAGLGLDEKGLGFRFTEEDLPRNQDRYRAIGTIFREYHEIAHLTPKQWKAVQLVYCEALSVAAAAKRCHITRKAIRTRIHRAYARVFTFASQNSILP